MCRSDNLNAVKGKMHNTIGEVQSLWFIIGYLLENVSAMPEHLLNDNDKIRLQDDIEILHKQLKDHFFPKVMN